MTIVDRITGIEASVAIKAPARVATTANITLSGEQTINGVAVVAGDRVLVKDQTDATENGVWVAATTAWTRATDFDGARDVATGTQVLVTGGADGAGLIWTVATQGDIAIGTSSITWAATVTVAGISSRAIAAQTAVYPQKRVYVRGCDAEGDGGGAWYEWVESEPATTRGKFTDAGGYYYRLSSRPILPRMFHGTDDDLAWEYMGEYIEAEFSEGRWRGGPNTAPGRIVGNGESYTLSLPVTITAPVSLDELTVKFEDGSLPMTLGSTTLNWRIDLREGFRAEFIGESDSDEAMIYIPRTWGGQFLAPTILPRNGDDGAEARYGLYVGPLAGWGLDFMGGNYFGGKCPLRIGRDGDHTGVNIGGGITIHHGSVMNLLGCNLNSANISGNIEHSEGAHNIVLTSKTNGGDDPARNITIENVYGFNTGGGAYAAGNSCINIGPATVSGTTGWDSPGVEITSEADASDIRINNVDAISDQNDIPILIRAAFGVEIEDVTYEYSSSGSQVMAHFSGSCASARLGPCRKQGGSGTALPNFTSAATNRILVTEAGTDAGPSALLGSTTTGTYTASTDESSWSVANGFFHWNIHVVAHSFSGYSGDIRLQLPTGISPAAGFRGPLVPLQYGWDESGAAKKIQLQAISGEAFVRILEFGEVTTITDADLPTGVDEISLHGTISFPVDRAS